MKHKRFLWLFICLLVLGSLGFDDSSPVQNLAEDIDSQTIETVCDSVRDDAAEFALCSAMARAYQSVVGTPYQYWDVKYDRNYNQLSIPAIFDWCHDGTYDSLLVIYNFAPNAPLYLSQDYKVYNLGKVEVGVNFSPSNPDSEFAEMGAHTDPQYPENTDVAGIEVHHQSSCDYPLGSTIESHVQALYTELDKLGLWDMQQQEDQAPPVDDQTWTDDTSDVYQEDDYYSDSGSNASSSSSNSAVDTIVKVGLTAAGLAGAATATAAGGYAAKEAFKRLGKQATREKQSETQEKKEADKPQKQYRLTASAQFLRFKPGDRRKLTVIAEVSKESGGWARAGNVPIQMRVSDGFSLTEDRGNGSVETAVIAKQTDQPARGQLTYAGFTPDGRVIPPQTLPLEIIVPEYQVVTNPTELLIPAGSQKTLRAAGMQRTPNGQLAPIEARQFSFTLLPNETPNRVDVSQQGTTGTAHIIPQIGAFTAETHYQIRVEATFPDGTTASTQVPVRISPVQYELVAEPASLQLVAGEQVACRVTPYAILPAGQKEITNDLYLHVEASSGLQASPPAVQGVLDLTVAAAPGKTAAGDQTIRVVASHGQGETSVEIPVELIKLVVKFL